MYWGALIDQWLCFCQFLLVIGLHDQWVYPSLSHSLVKMDLDDDDDDDDDPLDGVTNSERRWHSSDVNVSIGKIAAVLFMGTSS